jgi:hypothetical protein
MFSENYLTGSEKEIVRTDGEVFNSLTVDGEQVTTARDAVGTRLIPGRTDVLVMVALVTDRVVEEVCAALRRRRRRRVLGRRRRRRRG